MNLMSAIQLRLLKLQKTAIGKPSVTLEKSAEDASVSEDLATSAVESPFPDYTFEPLDKLGEVGVLILGVLITLIVGYGIGYVLKRD